MDISVDMYACACVTVDVSVDVCACVSVEVYACACVTVDVSVDVYACACVTVDVSVDMRERERDYIISSYSFQHSMDGEPTDTDIQTNAITPPCY